MMFLADCVTVFNDLGDEKKQAKADLVSYIKSVGEVCEVRAVAYHDIANSSSSSQTSNLYRAWLLSRQDGQASNSDSAIWKSKFIDYIEDYCDNRLHALKIKENPLFDSAQF